MIKKILYLIIITMWVLLTPNGWAQIDNTIWSIANINVDAQGSNELEAKKIALLEAKQQAYKLLFNKIIYIAEDSDITIPAWADDQIDDYIESLAINNEQFGGGRYVASITIIFAKEPVIEYFKKNNISYSLRQGSDILIVPVYTIGGDNFLWHDGSTDYNKIYQAFTRTKVQHNLLNFTLAEGNATDSAIISADDVININPVPLSQLAQHYKVSVLFLVHVEVSSLQSAQFINVKASLIGMAWDTIQYQWQAQLAIGKDIDEVLNNIALDLQQYLNQDWKKAHRINPNQDEQLYAFQVNFNNIQQWHFIKEKLHHINGFNDLTIHNFFIDNAHIIIKSTLQPDAILESLHEQDMLVRKGQRYPILQLQSYNNIK